MFRHDCIERCRNMCLHMCKRREKGQVEKLISVMLALVAVSIVCMAVFGYMDILYTKIDINQLSRQYILKMETNGYLTTPDRMELETGLRELGVSGISLAGTTMTDAGYGNEIALSFTGTITYQNLHPLSVFQAKKEILTQQIREKRVSTAKN